MTMKKFEEKTFNIPELTGISAKSVEEHLKLYSGYVKHANLIQTMIEQYSGVDAEDGKYSLAEITRRFAFEFDGMRNHEYYFSHLEGGPAPLADGSPLMKAIEEEWGSYDAWLTRFKAVASTRGVGWAILYYDPMTKRLLNNWNDEQHLGHLIGLSPILALDMWEHSFVADYSPSGKKQYIEDFFANLNWLSAEENFRKASDK
jgi:Fe-Mn family superoxide dismutase